MVLFASWSGPACAWLATLVRLVEQHPSPIGLYVMDSDDATRRAASRRSREFRAGTKLLRALPAT